MAKKKKTTKKRGSEINLSNADKHDLYEKSVQNADFDAELLNDLYTTYRGRAPLSIKEDFCGTAAFCCEWVKLDSKKTAIGVDLDAEVLAWGTKRNLSLLEAEQVERITLKKENVLKQGTPKTDIVVAFNFSYQIFKTREQLRNYFKVVKKSLKKDGLFAIDVFGGTEATSLVEEITEKEGFDYVWDHDDFNPITNELICHIHFDFKDGTRMEKAFTYDWRLYTIAELVEIMQEAGFKQVDVLWEGTDDSDGTGNGVFEKAEKGEVCESFVAYVVGCI